MVPHRNASNNLLRIYLLALRIVGDVVDLEEQRGPGRIRMPKPRPSRQRREKIAAYNAEADAFVRTDAVVTASAEGSVEVLYAARDEVAREAAALLWERRRQPPGSREAARISSRRVAALAEVGHLTVQIARAHPGEPSPERIRKVLGQLRKEVEGVIGDLFDAPAAAALRARLATCLPEDALVWGSPQGEHYHHHRVKTR